MNMVLYWSSTQTGLLTSKLGHITCYPTHVITSLLITTFLLSPWQPVGSQLLIVDPLMNQTTATNPPPVEIKWPSEVSIGVILPHRMRFLPYMFELVFPGIQEAVKTVEDDPNLLPGVNISLKTADSRCSDEYGPMAAITMFLERSVQLFLGPVCTAGLAPVARYSYNWSIPVMTAGALWQTFQDKSDYKLLTSVQGNYEKSADFVISILDHFHWNHTGFLMHTAESVNWIGGPLNSDECLQIIRPIYNGQTLRTGNRSPYSGFDEHGKVDWKAQLETVNKSSRSEYHYYITFRIREWGREDAILYQWDTAEITMQ